MVDVSVTPPPATTIHTKLVSDFDAGINTSAVWTESLERDHSLSDEELDEDEGSGYLHQTGRPARALYAFEGKQEFKEVTVEAGDEIEVLREEVGDGWSLVRLVVDGTVTELGLLPQTYYTVRMNSGHSHAYSDSFRTSSQQTSGLHPLLVQFLEIIQVYAEERHLLPLLLHPKVLRRPLHQHYLWFHSIPENGSPVSVGVYLEAKVSTDLLVLLLVGRRNGFSRVLPKIRSHSLPIIGFLVSNTVTKTIVR